MSNFETKRNIASANTPGGGMVIGDPVIGGTPGQVLYIDVNGDLFGDDGFIRDSVSKETVIAQEYNGGDGAGFLVIADGTFIPVQGPVIAYNFDDGVDSFISYAGAVNDSGDIVARLSSFNNNTGQVGQIDVQPDQIMYMLQNGDNFTSAVQTQAAYIIASFDDATTRQGKLQVTPNYVQLEVDTPTTNGRFYADNDEAYMRFSFDGDNISNLRMDGSTELYHQDLTNNDRASVFLDADSNFEAKISYYTDSTGRLSSITVDPTGIMTKADSNLFYWRNQDDVTTFAGGGLNDITWDGTDFSGSENNTYMIVVHEEDAVTLTANGLPTGAFDQDEPITASISGATGFVVMWRADIGQLVIRDVVNGPFVNGDVITGGVSGATQLTTGPSGSTYDVFYVATGGPATYFYQYSNEYFDIGSGLLARFGATTGHTDGEQWTWTRTLADTLWMNSTNTTGNIFIENGDLDNIVTGLKQRFDITNNIYELSSTMGSRYISLDIGTGYYLFGDIDTNMNGTYSFWNSDDAIYTLFSNGNRFIEMNMDPGALTFSFGDMDVLGLGTRIVVDAVNNKTYIGGLMVNTPPAYDDNAAALGGGLVAGEIYQTTGSGAAPLNVAGIMMVTQ